MTASASSARHFVLYDGECGLCERFAGWVRRRDTLGRFEVVAYQDCPAPPMTPALAEACTRAVHVVTARGRVIRAGRAVLFILHQLGYRCSTRVLAIRPFLWMVELGYAFVARNRGWLARLTP